MANAFDRDQGAKCENIAKQALALGDKDKALRFLRKAINLYPTDSAKALLVQLETGTYAMPKESDVRMRRAAAAAKAAKAAQAASPESERKEERNYTPEQLAAVKEKRGVKDYYRLLGLTKGCTPREVKKAYHRLALKFHPDKNRAPGAADVFKRVNAAHTCLSDEKKRRHYDQTGQDEADGGPSGGGHGMRRGGFQPDHDDIFEMFFGSNGFQYGRPHPHTRFYQQQRAQQRTRRTRGGGGGSGGGGGGNGRGGNGGFSLAQLAQFLPIIILFLFSMLNAPPGGPGAFYQLDSDSAFRVSRTTASGTPYFVEPSFSRRFDRDLRGLYQVEMMADRAYLDRTQEQCTTERKRRAKKINKAQKSSGSEKAEKLYEAHSMETPACDRLEDLLSRGVGK